MNSNYAVRVKKRYQALCSSKLIAHYC